jgi:hypothetical protein
MRRNMARKAVKKKPPPKMPKKEPIWVAVKGYKVGDHLGVTPSFSHGGRWVLSHVHTGMKINPDNFEFRTATAGVKAARAISKLKVNWGKMKQGDAAHNKSVAGEKKYQKIMDIIREHAL